MARLEHVPLPPWSRTAEGRVRRCGVEFEFSGLDIQTIATLTQAELGGTIEHLSAYECRVKETPLGTFVIELDFAYLKKLGRQSGAREDSAFDLDRLPEELLAMLARQVVPFEVVTPPLPLDRLSALEPLIGRLRDAGALGTRHAVLYAFGLHMNPELPRLDAATILAYLRAFLCLYDWLLRTGDVDWSRRLTPYIRPFPREYVRRIIDEGYAPEREQLMEDYLDANPERNRALDMLPLFDHLDHARVRRAVADPRVKPRPALHYRLPNCDIDQSGWGVLGAWRHWLQVEHLASDGERLARVCREFADFLDRPVGSLLGDWARACEQWLLSEREL